MYIFRIVSCFFLFFEHPDARVLTFVRHFNDFHYRVHGIRNLRVADASVMPIVTSGNTNAPSIMIGEKAADLILKKDSVHDIKRKIKHILQKL